MGSAFKGKTTVLLVDEEEELLFLAGKKLEMEGYSIRISQNGENMMDIITQTPPDIIILDLHMKGIDGGTICQLIKSNKSTAGIPVIVFSANEDIERITGQCRADGYIRKPFMTGDFKDMFLHILGP